MNRKFTLTVVALLLAAILPLFAFASSASKAPLSYTVTVNTAEGGQLYWNYGKNMEFFLIGDDSTYNQKCLAEDKQKYTFSTLMTRGLIAKPDDEYYFDGIYDQTGRRLPSSKTNIDLIRITIDGVYFYDYVTAYDNPIYRNFTPDLYQKTVKSYLKTLYGTSRYKVLGHAILYEMPKKSMTIYPKFRKKTVPELNFDSSVSKTYGDSDFYLIPELPKDFNGTFRSSGSRVLTVDKGTGLVNIKGEGIASVTVKIPETDYTLAADYKIKVAVRPRGVSLISAKRTDAKTVSVKWKKDINCSGYEIQLSPTRSFSTITAKKTAASGKTSETSVTVRKDSTCSYLRIRPYKRSCGEKLYGRYDVIKIS